MRICGDCTLCCTLLPIELPIENASTTFHETCKFCKNNGCSIHVDRPEICRGFECEWINDETIPEDLRPDKCNVIFEKIEDNILMGLEHFNHIGSYKEKNVSDFISDANKKGTSFIISSYTNTPKVLLPGINEDKKTMIEKIQKHFK